MSDAPVLGAVLDTDVLFPPTLRDLLLYTAEAGVFRLYWSATILEELRRNLVRVVGLSEDVAARRVRWMADAFPDAMVPVNPERAARLANDPKDRHVLAVAVEAGASVIVTRNVRHFPAEALEPHGVEAWPPDTFLSHLLRERRQEMLDVVRFYAGILTAPPRSPAELLVDLARHTPSFAEAAQASLEGRWTAGGTEGMPPEAP